MFYYDILSNVLLTMLLFHRLSVVDENYRSYFRGTNEEDDDGSTRKRKRTERVLGAPGEEDWENARYVICFTIINFICFMFFALFYLLITFVLFYLFV